MTLGIVNTNLVDKIPNRVMVIGIEVNGVIKNYENLNMTATGTKYANATQNECEVKISNLDAATRNFILNETSPFNKNRTPKKLYVTAGYQSTGSSLIFVGDIISSLSTQPPDITITLRASTKNFEKGNIVSVSVPGTMPLKDLSQLVADKLNTSLDYQAINKTISNYNHTGANLKQVNKLSEIGLVDAYIDNNTLVIKNRRVPLLNSLRILNAKTGMIGVPETTEIGIKVKFLIDTQTKLGGALQVESITNPAVNGVYVIYKLNFEIATRDKPFYWIAEALKT